jgi:hypothetical protein
VELHSVGPAFVLHDEIPCAFRIDAEDAPEWGVDDVQVALAIECRAFEEAFDFGVLPIRVGPAGAAFLAEFAGHR